MKADFLKLLKDSGQIEFFTEERYTMIKEVMKYGMKQDAWLNNYLSLDPLNKAQWCADHFKLLYK